MVGVSFQYNAITSEGLHVLCPVLQSFNKLTAIDLAYNGIVLLTTPGGQSTITILADALAALPLLCRLNLSGVRMRDCVKSVLGGLARPLIALRLSGCGLRATDFAWLATSSVTSCLEELDIGANNLTTSITAVLSLLCHAAGTLAILEAEEAELNAAAALALFITFARMPQLRYANVASNDIGAPAVVESLELFSKVERLRAVRLTVPSDIVPPADVDQSAADYADQMRDTRTDFAKRLSDLMSRLCMIYQRPDVRLIFRL